jgi:hypothetical protein
VDEGQWRKSREKLFQEIREDQSVLQPHHILIKGRRYVYGIIDERQLRGAVNKAVKGGAWMQEVEAGVATRGMCCGCKAL